MVIKSVKIGVTLIALAITIVVIFILIGVSINYALGDRGIISQTNDISDSVLLSQAEEAVRTAWTSAKVQYKMDGINSTGLELKNYLENKDNLNIHLIDSGAVTANPIYDENEGLYIVKYRSIEHLDIEFTFYIKERGRIVHYEINEVAPIELPNVNVSEGSSDKIIVSLNKTNAVLQMGNSLNLIANVRGTTDSIIWSIPEGDSKVGLNTTTGNTVTVTPTAVGKAKITATVGGKSATCNITVVSSVNINLSTTNLSLSITDGVPQTSNLTATITGDENPNTIIWSVTSGSSKVSLSSTTGSTITVTPLEAGNAVITATVGYSSVECNVTITSINTSISLDKSNMDLKIIDGTAQTESIIATVSGTTNPVNWSITSGTNKVSLSSTTGNTITVTPLAAGDAVITATIGSKTATCNVTVTSVTTSISLDKSSMELKIVDGTAQTGSITATVSGTTNPVNWSITSGTNKVSLSSTTGNTIIVTPLAAGNAVITATIGSKTATCNVTVTSVTTSISLDKSSIDLEIIDEIAQTANLTATVTGTTNTVNWLITTGASNVSLSSTTGNTVTVTPLAEGNAVITATVGSKTATCNVTISSKKTISLIFDANGGTFDTQPETYIGYSGESIGTLPTSPTPPTGKVFIGWYDASSGGNKIYDKTETTGNFPESSLTLYAHWWQDGFLGEPLNANKYGWSLPLYGNGSYQAFDYSGWNDYWRLFYQDESYSYIIGRVTGKTYYPLNNISSYSNGSYVSTEGRNLNSKLKNNGFFTSSNTRKVMRVVAWLTDTKSTSIWSQYYKDSNGTAEYAIGSPTVELYVASYIATHPSIEAEISINSAGYVWPNSVKNVSGAHGIYRNSQNGTYYSWMLASPSEDSYFPFWTLSYSSSSWTLSNGDGSDWSTRPIVCIKTSTFNELYLNYLRDS